MTESESASSTVTQQVIRLERSKLESDPGPGERPKLTQDQVNALFHEVVRRNDSYGPITPAVHETATLRLRIRMARERGISALA